IIGFNEIGWKYQSSLLGNADSAMKIVSENSVFTLNLCHFFFTGCQPFKPDTILQLGQEERLWMMETETQRSFPGHRSQNEIEALQKAGLRYLLHEVLICWQVWEQFASKLTRNQDSVTNLQGKRSKLLIQNDSPCQMWAGESIQVSEDGKYVMKLQEESSISIKNQEFPFRTNWDFWRK
uniref:KRAB domain-containing protein n=1 Tax=Loxodonta africana TaxID=9785 RepID=G3U8V0_LOXAF